MPQEPGKQHAQSTGTTESVDPSLVGTSVSSPVSRQEAQLMHSSVRVVDLSTLQGKSPEEIAKILDSLSEDEFKKSVQQAIDSGKFTPAQRARFAEILQALSTASGELKDALILQLKVEVMCAATDGRDPGHESDESTSTQTHHTRPFEIKPFVTFSSSSDDIEVKVNRPYEQNPTSDSVIHKLTPEEQLREAAQYLESVKKKNDEHTAKVEEVKHKIQIVLDRYGIRLDLQYVDALDSGLEHLLSIAEQIQKSRHMAQTSAVKSAAA